jgi:hypothetical protein
VKDCYTIEYRNIFLGGIEHEKEKSSFSICRIGTISLPRNQKGNRQTQGGNHAL